MACDMYYIIQPNSKCLDVSETYSDVQSTQITPIVVPRQVVLSHGTSQGSAHHGRDQT